MLRFHILPSHHWVDDDAWAAVTGEAERAVADIRAHLPTLPDDLYLLVHQTSTVIPETGDGGFAVGPQVIRWDVDPARGVGHVARTSLRHTLFHECHHAVRLQRRPEEADLLDWLTISVFEGLASVFEATEGGFDAPWRRYDPAVIEGWARELLAQPVDDTWPHWKFEHPDGRSSIAYRIGSWLVDRAVERTGRTAADLVWASPTEVADLAGFEP